MSQQEMTMFVVGVVGRAMGSGQFTAPDSIANLTKEAVAAFQEHLEPHLAKAASAPSQSPGASQGHQATDWHAGAHALAGGPPAAAGGVPAETMSFNVWGGDKNYLYGRNEETWADILGKAQGGDSSAREALEKGARAKVVVGDKWEKANTRRVARCKACLGMLRGAP